MFETKDQDTEAKSSSEVVLERQKHSFLSGVILCLCHVYSSASLYTNPKYICLEASTIDFNGNLARKLA